MSIFLSSLQRLRFLLQGSPPSRDVCTAFSIFFPFARTQACISQIVIIMMGSYNTRLIYPIGYSRRRCGSTTALIRQPQTHPHNEELEIRNRILCEGVRFLGVGGNQSARRKPTTAGMELANQIHIQPLASCIGERKV